MALLATPSFSQGVNMTIPDDKASRRLLTELSNALSARTHEAANASQELRDAVCEYVAAEQARGTALKEVLATVKQLLAKAEILSGYSSDTMASQLMDWCLEFHSQRTYLPPAPDGLPTA